MADGTIDSELIYFIDNWPSGPITEVDWPMNQLISSTWQNVITPYFPIGTRVSGMNEYDASHGGVPGPFTCMYLQVGTQDATPIAAKTVCVHDSATLWYQVTNDPDSCIDATSGCCAIALSAVTDAYFGFFLVGGVVPEFYVSGLGGNFATKNDVIAGPFGTGAGTAVTTLALPTTLKSTCGYTLSNDS